MNYSITYFNERVFNDAKALPNKLKARYVALSEKIQQEGADLGMPHARALGKGLFELRVKAQEGIARCFYCVFYHREIVILHCMLKKSQRISRRIIALIQKRQQEVMYGYTAQ